MKDFLKDYFRRFIIVLIVFIIYGVISATAAFIAWLIVKDGNSPFYRLVEIVVFIAVLPLIGALLNKGGKK